jgi:thiol-disulfide isomerase/thioredoxin
MIISLIFIICLFSSQSNSKQTSLDYETIVKYNNKLFSQKNQIIGISYNSKTRFISDTFEKKILVHLSIENQDEFEFIDSFYVLYFKTQKDKILYKNRDSANFVLDENFKSDFNLKKWQIPSYLKQSSYIHYIPNSNNKSYLDSNFKKVKSSFLNGVLVFEHVKNGTSLHRKTYVNTKKQIFRVEYFDYDMDNLQEFWSIDFIIYPKTTLYEIAKNKSYGPFRDISKHIKYQYIPNLYNSDTLQINVFQHLNNELIKIDTSITKYYIFDFWYISCSPCHLFRKDLEALHNIIDPNKIKIFSINVFDKKNDILNFNQYKKYEIPEIIRDHKFKVFDYKSHPTVLILDNQLKIIKKFVGYDNNYINQINEIINN